MGERYERVETIEAGDVELEGELSVPPGASGVVLFAHGSGSSRFSPRNSSVARRLREEGLATLLFDLLTEEEDREYRARFDIAFLTERLLGGTDWARSHPETEGLDVGYFGSSTGAAAALRGAARDQAVGAVVSRGGRVDLASEVLGDVTAPTLFVVGGDDADVLELNRAALDRLGGVRRLEVVEGAGHLFEGPGQLGQVADLAADWFARYLGT